MTCTGLIGLHCLLAVTCMAASAAGYSMEKRADTIIVAGRVITMDTDRPEAQAVAIEGHSITAVGTEKALKALASNNTVWIRLNKATVLPGFIDSHGHFLGLGKSLSQLRLRGVDDFANLVRMVEAAARKAKAGEWIVGRGWHQESLRVPPEFLAEGYPTHHELSRVAPKNPVYLRHQSGHACLVNLAAMGAAGIGKSTPDPEAGRIVRLPDGSPSGVLLESACDTVEQALERWQGSLDPETKSRQFEKAVQLATRHCLERGVTTFQDAGSTFEEIDMLRALARRGRLGMRLWVMIGEPDERLAGRIDDYRIEGEGGWLWVRAIKRYADGALGSRGAWMLEDYNDKPGWRGLPQTTPEALERTARIALEHGLQLCTHAIGDAANRMVLDVYEKVLATVPDGRQRRWRIEHAQHISPRDIPRFAKLGIIASMQSYHCVSDGPWVERRIGKERARAGAYAWRSLLQSGAIIAWGTDTPVEREDPIAGYYAFVTRRMPHGDRFHSEQTIGRLEALRAMTRDAARAAGLENLVGTIRPGMKADLVVLDADPLTIPEDKIPSLRVLMTILDGRIVYDSSDR